MITELIRKILDSILGNPQLDELQEVFERLKFAKERCDRELDDARKALQELRSRLQNALQAHQDAVAENARLNVQADELEEQITKLTKECHDLKKRLKLALGESRVEIERYQKFLSEEATKNAIETDKLRASLKETELKSQEDHAIMLELADELESTKYSLSAIKKDFTALTEKVADLNKEVSDKDKKIAFLQEQSKEKEKLNAQVVTDLEEALSKIEELEKHVTEKDRELQSAKTKISEMDKELEEAVNIHESTGEELFMLGGDTQGDGGHYDKFNKF